MKLWPFNMKSQPPNMKSQLLTETAFRTKQILAVKIRLE